MDWICTDTKIVFFHKVVVVVVVWNSSDIDNHCVHFDRYNMYFWLIYMFKMFEVKFHWWVIIGSTGVIGTWYGNVVLYLSVFSKTIIGQVSNWFLQFWFQGNTLGKDIFTCLNWGSWAFVICVLLSIILWKKIWKYLFLKFSLEIIFLKKILFF